MSDLEEKGFLFHPHTSAGRFRRTRRTACTWIRSLRVRRSADRHDASHEELAAERIVADREHSRRAAQTLGLLTQELGVALGPALDLAFCAARARAREQSQRLAMVLTLEGGVVRTVFVEVRARSRTARLAR
jgi:heat-inducible transcriptional repressor